MAYLKFNQTTEIRSKIITRLNTLGLESNDRMMKTLEENSKHLNRLTALFHVLKQYNITLDDKLHETIASNVSYASNAVNVIKISA